MAIEVQDGFKISTAKPVDERYQFATIADRDALNPLERYEGLTTYVVETGMTYTLVGGIGNEHWMEGGSGSGAGVITVADLTELNAIPEEDRLAGMLVYVESNTVTYQLRGGIDNSNWVVFGQPTYLIVLNADERLALTESVRQHGLKVFQQD